MQTERPFVLTVAGFDPCSGAGLTADIKTFEQLKTYGLAVCTGLTMQTHGEFIAVEWRSAEEVNKEIELLLKVYPVKAVKFGIVPSFDFLNKLVNTIKKNNSGISIVVDPVGKSSTGFSLNESSVFGKNFLQKVTLFTPNVPELELMSNGKDIHEFIIEFVSHSNLLLKGGHKKVDLGIDTLYLKDETVDLLTFQDGIYPKHGSGCVLSAAITAYLALGKDVKEACFLAKNYIEKFLSSNKSLLGYHVA